MNIKYSNGMHHSTVGLYFHEEKKTTSEYLFYSKVLTKYKLYRINAGPSAQIHM